VLFLVMIEDQFLTLHILINPCCNMKFDPLFLRPLLYILCILTCYFFTENLTSTIGRRVDMCFVSKEEVLPEIMDSFVFVLAAVCNTCSLVCLRNDLSYIGLFELLSILCTGFKAAY
jgi:hypothetical protein